MREFYRIPLPLGAHLEARHRADALGAASTEAGLDACRVFFSGTVAFLALDGEGNLLRKLRGTRAGGRLLEALDQGGLDPARHRVAALLSPEAEGGPLRAVYVLPILAGHRDELAAALREAWPRLPSSPVAEAYLGEDLTLLLAADSAEEVEALLAGPAGRPLQDVLAAHTGYSRHAWRNALSFDLDAVRSGLLSQDNAQDPLPGVPLDQGEAMGAEGPWVPPPTFAKDVSRH